MQTRHTQIRLTTVVLSAVLAFGFFSQVLAQEGDRVAEKFLNNVVQLTVTLSTGDREHGFGFVVGERGEMLYLVTADHVVRSKDPDVVTQHVQVRFYVDRGKSYTAELLDVSYRDLDLALLEIRRPFADYTWEPQCVCLHPKRGDRVWFIGRNEEWFVPLDDEAGTIREDPFLGTFSVSLKSVQPGTSGAPLIATAGMAGMIIEDSLEEAIVLDIATIQQVVTEEWGYSWGLEGFQPVTTPTPTPEPKPTPILTATSTDDLTWTLLRDIVIHNGFTATLYNKSSKKYETIYGSFRNAFERQGEVVVDYATGRMWQRSTFGPFNFVEAQAYIDQLNHQRFAGYSNWRIPTILELASLTQARGVKTTFLVPELHLDSNYFHGNAYYCMSSDRVSDPSVSGTAVFMITWAGPGSIGILDVTQQYPVKAVRTIK